MISRTFGQKEVMVQGLRGASKSNGYDHDITHRYGPRNLFRWRCMLVDTSNMGYCHVSGLELTSYHRCRGNFG